MTASNPKWMTLREALSLVAFGEVLPVAIYRDRADANTIADATAFLHDELAAARIKVEFEWSDGSFEPADPRRSSVAFPPPIATPPETLGQRLDLNPRAVNPGYVNSRGQLLAQPREPVAVHVEAKSLAVRLGERDRAARGPRQREAACRDWLRCLVESGPKDHSKDWYRQEAVSRFGVSARGFSDRVWAQTVNATSAWRRPGRRAVKS